MSSSKLYKADRSSPHRSEEKNSNLYGSGGLGDKSVHASPTLGLRQTDTTFSFNNDQHC